MTVAALLRRMMKAKGFRSQSQLARAAKVSRQQISRIYSGDRPNPGVETIRPIVEAMGGTMAEFFEGE